MSSPNSWERRRSPRIPCDATARLTVLREWRDPVGMDVTVAEYSDSGLRLRVPLQVSPGEAVRVDWGDLLLLGEVVHTHSPEVFDSSRSWVIGIQVEQGIFDVKALANLLSAVAGDQSQPLREPEGAQSLDQRKGQSGG